jgi:hypothetical protein
LREALERGVSPGEVVTAWEADLGRFRARRRPFLLYPE